MHRLFRFGILGLLTLAIIPSEDPLKANISTDIIGPFEKFQSDQIFTYNYSLNRNASNIHEELKIINDETGALCKKIVKAQHSFVRFSKEKVDFDIPLSKWFSDDGLHFRFSVFQNTTEISFVIAIIYLTSFLSALRYGWNEFYPNLLEAVQILLITGSIIFLMRLKFSGSLFFIQRIFGRVKPAKAIFAVYSESLSFPITLFK